MTLPKKREPDKENHFLLVSRELLAQGKTVRFQAKGWSMQPTIRDGDFVTVSPEGVQSVSIGDIVLVVDAEGKALVHRIIWPVLEGRQHHFLLKGDACVGKPEKVESKNILGRVVLSERGGRKRRLDVLWRRLAGLIFVGVSPVTIWILPIVIKMKEKMFPRGE